MARTVTLLVEQARLVAIPPEGFPELLLVDDLRERSLVRQVPRMGLAPEMVEAR